MSSGGAARQMASLLPLIESKGSKDRETCSMPLQAGGSPHTISLSSRVPQKRHLRAMQSSSQFDSFKNFQPCADASRHNNPHSTCHMRLLHLHPCAPSRAPTPMRPRPCAHAVFDRPCKLLCSPFAWTHNIEFGSSSCSRPVGRCEASHVSQEARLSFRPSSRPSAGHKAVFPRWTLHGNGLHGLNTWLPSSQWRHGTPRPP